MKLWTKDNTNTSKLIEDFTVGHDREFDMRLARYDVMGSRAHAQMLADIGLLSADELHDIDRVLQDIDNQIVRGEFTIDEQAEDIHSHIETLLTEQIGEAGKKIHSGRSRNDQIAVDIKLYLRAEMLIIKDEVRQLFALLMEQSDRYRDDLLPGYTHMQIAMPSSFGLWFGAYAESLIDDLEMLLAAYHIANKNPLGSGAGYGSSFALNRTRTTELLNFETLNYNAVYAQMTRGKTERSVAFALSSVAATLGKLSMDICLYMSQNFGFVSFPDELTTGSSIMPHKKNPDVFELIRAKCNRIQSVPNELTLLINNLASGYHRDLQLTKEVLFPAIEELLSCIRMAVRMISRIEIKKDILNDEKYKYLFSVEAVNALVNQGIAFREAYRQVGNQINNGTFFYDHHNAIKHTHEGSMGNLCNEQIREEFNKLMSRFH